MRPSSAIEPTFILRIKLLRWTFTVVIADTEIPGYLLTQTTLRHLNHYFPLSAT